MMRTFRDISIKRKLMVIIVLTSSIVLLLASVAFVINDFITFRRAMIEELSTLAEVIGTNSTAALTFDDGESAKDTLAALEAKPHITSACIYTKDGKVFAEYFSNRLDWNCLSSKSKGDKYHLSGSHWQLPKVVEEGYDLRAGHLVLFKPITLDDERIGAVYLEFDLQGLSSRLQWYVSICAIIMLASLLVAFLLSSKIQRPISEPILHLAQTTKIISEEKNYTIRVEKQSNDEVGILIDGFNEMLAQIQVRDEELEGHRDSLEEQVDMRTAELSKANQELEQAVVELKMAKEVAEAANEELKAFAYSIAHELRSPLRSMDGFSQALLEDYADKVDEDGVDYLQRVRAASQRMAQLVDDLLTLSRLTRREIRREKLDLSQLAQTIAAELQQQALVREVEFVIEKGVVATGDAYMLQVALENLLGNAWKYTSQHPHAKIDFGVTPHNGETAYFVRDDGVGFDMDYIDKLFGIFQRLHAMTEFEGTGTGLAIVERIIKRHGGRVWAEGAVEQGATFYFTL